MPFGLLVTVPWPAGTVTDNCSLGKALKVAVTEVLADKLTWQVEDPLQAPVQPANVEPVEGIAVNWTTVSVVKDALQLEVQPIAAGLLFTTPLPFPENCTVKDWEVSLTPTP